MSFLDTLQERYKGASLLLRFIYINIAVFVVLRLLGLFSLLICNDSSYLVKWVELPSDAKLALHRPWTVFTYMFSHYGVFHILFNMLWLYWLGRIFLEFFNPRQLGGLYVLGGLGGAAFYLLCYNLLPTLSGHFGMLLGASASVMAIVIAVTIYRPDYRVGLMFFGGIALKWITLATVFIGLLSIEGDNMGGYLSHIGGMLVGLLFGLSIKRGHDITSWINRCIDVVVSFFKGRNKKTKSASYKYQHSTSTSSTTSSSSNYSSSDNSKVDEARLDEILGKLKQSGYGALTEEEREFLFNTSRKR